MCFPGPSKLASQGVCFGAKVRRSRPISKRSVTPARQITTLNIQVNSPIVARLVGLARLALLEITGKCHVNSV